jgi:hypothetical protein
MAGERTCGGCTMCCKLLGVVELDKPMGVWCSHAVKGKGCAIYEQRPPTCRGFDCFWLSNAEMADYWKPDRSKMVVAGDESGTQVSIIVDSSYPDAWKKHPYYSDLKAWSQRLGTRLQVVTAKHSWVIFPEEDLFLGERRSDDTIVYWGYKQHRLMRQPAVSILRSDGTTTEVLGGLYPLA